MNDKKQDTLNADAFRAIFNRSDDEDKRMFGMVRGILWLIAALLLLPVLGIASVLFAIAYWIIS